MCPGANRSQLSSGTVQGKGEGWGARDGPRARGLASTLLLSRSPAVFLDKPMTNLFPSMDAKIVSLVTSGAARARSSGWGAGCHSWPHRSQLAPVTVRAAQPRGAEREQPARD